MVLQLPNDVRSWLLGVFSNANAKTSGHLTRVPTVHETFLDETLILDLAQVAVPYKFPSDWTVKIGTYFIGSGRHWSDRWEIADIGVLVMFRRAGKLIRTKVALLQSKRLYPNEQKGRDRPDHVGFGRLHESDDAFTAAVRPRTFTFKDACRYKAFQIDSDQYTAIENYEDLSSIPIYYFLYHPWQIPLSVKLPAESQSTLEGACEVGCRVLPALEFRTNLAHKLDGLTPSYGDMAKFETGPFADAENKAGWRFETFIVDMLIGCKTGYIASDSKDSTLANLFGGRTAPISSAISINIDAPAGAGDESLPE